jgi:hypothetical protein
VVPTRRATGVDERMEGTTVEGGTIVAGETGMRELVATLAEQNAQLEHALESRVLIEQAKGMLAERWDVTPEHAFVLLRGAARAHRMRVRDLARTVLESRTTPTELQEVSPR